MRDKRKQNIERACPVSVKRDDNPFSVKLLDPVLYLLLLSGKFAHRIVNGDSFEKAYFFLKRIT